MSENSNSILDRVMDSHKSQEKEQFYPSELVSTLLKYLSGKEEDIIRRRFGLNKPQSETLEEIGASYKVTRERIRQIENNSINKILALKNFNDQITPVEHIISSLLAENGGFMNEKILLENLVGYSDDKEIDERAVLFIIKVLLKGKYKYLDNQVFRSGWGLRHTSSDLAEKIINELVNIVENSNQPLSADTIIEKFKKTNIYSEEQQNLSDDAIISYLNLSRKIGVNPYQEYGLANWGSIEPKRINDKIYLVLKKKNEPMHFGEIANEINRIGFDKRKAYPPTIHNELIMNDQYVLVGRGIYALKEWGYKPGVVSEVIQEILRKEGKALSRQELVKKVLEKRIVKKNTIHLALTDRNKFQKTGDGNYSLVAGK